MKTTAFIQGHPVPQPRPRTFMRKGFPTTISDNPASKGWKTLIQMQSGRLPKRANGIKGPMSVGLAFKFLRPKSHFRADGVTLNKEQKSRNPTTRCTSHGKGDVDNLAKAVLDALETCQVFADDSQVWELMASKEWVRSVDLEGVEITIFSDSIDYIIEKTKV